MTEILRPLSLKIEIEQWPLKVPFRIANREWRVLDVVLVTLEHAGLVGKGEAAGVYYKNESAASIRDQIEAVRPQIEAGISKTVVQKMLPLGGARNAIDCAWWDLQAKLDGTPAWEAAGLERPRPLLTTFTCGAEAPRTMAAAARAYTGARAIKIKLTGEAVDGDRVRAVRDALPNVWLSVDANQGFDRESLDRLLPVFVDARVELIEQPFPRGKEEWLDGLKSPIPIALDESVQGLADVAAAVSRCSVINIKLDKCGGLTEGLQMAHAARKLGLQAMVGNMLGTSLAMAPAFLVGQLCKVVDLDGPTFLDADRSESVRYRDGFITCPEGLWG